jgi:hypothetical protein
MIRGPDLLVNKRISFNLKLKTGDADHPKERQASAKAVRKMKRAYNEMKFTKE